MNEFILDSHRAKIRDTPFKWCLHMDKALAICNPLMLELVKRWFSVNNSFRIMQQSVPLTIGDICMCLGLAVGGIDVQFDRNVCGSVGSLLSGQLITIDNVIEKMKLLVGSKVDDVDNVCRMYLFVCFAVLYFPRNSKNVCNIPCSILDNIDGLSKYNWAKAVHSYLVRSIGRAFLALGQREICLSGSAVVLQVSICIIYV